MIIVFVFLHLVIINLQSSLKDKIRHQIFQIVIDVMNELEYYYIQQYFHLFDFY